MGRRWKRQILLFLFAIVVPAAVLVTLTVRLVRQEAELGAKRVETARRDAAEQLRRELSARLDVIKASFASLPPSNPAIVFVARLEQDRMILPWEEKIAHEARSTAFTSLQSEGESREFLVDDPAAATVFYRRATAAAKSPFEKCQNLLSLGRVLFKQGKKSEAGDTFRAMLSNCDSATDDDGISFALYAAERLMTDGERLDSAKDYIVRKASSTGTGSLVQAYFIRALLSKLDAVNPNVSNKLSADIRDMERMAALAQDFHAPLFRMEFPFGARPGAAAWMAYGDEPWLITIITPAPLATPIVLAVSSKKVAPPGVTLVAQHTPNSLRIGEGFLDLEVEWPDGKFASAAQKIPATLYGTGIALMLSTTILAGYLLLRDVMREAQIAEMRALFVASVSHELKTPLTAIRMFGETLGKDRPPDEVRRKDYARTIVNESERLSRLVDNLLDSSRIEYGEKIYRKKWISPAEVVRSAADAMQYPLAQKGFALDIAIDDDLPGLFADADAIEQAILNLLTNAMKYSGDARSIRLNLKRSGDDVVIEVIDRGLGIEPSEQKRIFDRFYRVRSETTDRVTGAGLGLTLALHIVDAHGGRLEVASEPGQGSTFCMRLPLAPA